MLSHCCENCIQKRRLQGLISSRALAPEGGVPLLYFGSHYFAESGSGQRVLPLQATLNRHQFVHTAARSALSIEGWDFEEEKSLDQR
jgi:hypothetical protein